MNRLTIGAGIALLVFALPATATTEIYRFHGERAYAWFSKTDGCVNTYVEIQGYAKIGRNGLKEPEQSSVWIEYGFHNTCTEEFWRGKAISSNVKFQAASPLKSATLNGNMMVYDPSTNSNKMISLDLQWTGTGNIIHVNSREREPDDPPYALIYRYVGTYRDATISGNVWLDGNSLIEGSSYGLANLSYTNSGTIEVQR